MTTNRKKTIPTLEQQWGDALKYDETGRPYVIIGSNRKYVKPIKPKKAYTKHQKQVLEGRRERIKEYQEEGLEKANEVNKIRYEEKNKKVEELRKEGIFVDDEGNYIKKTAPVEKKDLTVKKEDFTKLATHQLTDALNVMVDLMNNSDNEKIKLDAAKTLIDRVMGKSKETIETTQKADESFVDLLKLVMETKGDKRLKGPKSTTTEPDQTVIDVTPTNEEQESDV